MMIPHKELCCWAILKNTSINKNTSGKTGMKKVIDPERYETRSKH